MGMPDIVQLYAMVRPISYTENNNIKISIIRNSIATCNIAWMIMGNGIIIMGNGMIIMGNGMIR